MGLTREQAQQASDITFEEVYVPEWMSGDDRKTLAEVESKLDNLNGDDPALRSKLEQEQTELRSRGLCFVWSLTAFECENLQSDTQKHLGKDKQHNTSGFFARLVVATVRDMEGNPLFTSKDVGWLSKKSFKVLNRIANVALRLSGLSKEDQDEILKN